MNSEELEQSLRTEFESSLKNVLADMRQEISQFQEKIEAEIEKHKSQLDDVFRDFSSRISVEKELDAGFKESVVEHLRLARDEGARITATAIGEAEELERESAQQKEASAGIAELRDAVNDISSQTTQASILKALVQHAAAFTPRGAFFIIKNEHLVGWRVFGKEGYSDEKAVREVFFPVSLSTILGESVRSLSTVESTYGVYTDDSIYLNKLEFGQPDKMYAIPLVVRGRSVAVLYTDYGNEGGEANVEALETLARFASMTVEVLASARNVKEPQAEESEQSYSAQSNKPVENTAPVEATSAFQPAAAEQQPANQFTEAPVNQVPEYNYSGYEPAANKSAFVAEEKEQTFSEPSSQSFETVTNPYAQSTFEEAQPQASKDFSVEQPQTQGTGFSVPEVEYQTTEENNSWNSPVQEVEQTPNYSQYYEPEADTLPVQANNYSTPTVDVNDYQNNYQFETHQPFEKPESQFETSQGVETVQSEVPQYEISQFQTPQYEAPQSEPAESFTPPPVQDTYSVPESPNGRTENYIAEPVEPAVTEPASPSTAQATRTRFSDRNVDLPIEVGEEERRLHNDARRFARLLVSEIKLYNEQKVKEGREARDLYDRLREAIDRSREMYDKRVQPPVAARFDYFHYELVNTLAEGDENNLGADYPGTAV